MNALQKTFLSMIKTVFGDTPFVMEKGVTSSELFQESCRYELAGVLSTKLDLFCQDAEVRARWSQKAMSDYKKNFRILQSQVILNSVLAEKNIKPVIIKGMASAYYYLVPLLRQTGDIDFLIQPEQFDECCKLLEQNGYQKSDDSLRHIKYQKQGITYECHRFFSSNNYSSQDKWIDHVLHEGCKSCITRNVDGRDFYVLPDAENGIVLLEHLKHHLLHGVGFRQIMDWVVYADAFLDDAAWKSSFQNLARDCGLERLAQVMTKTAQLFLGLGREKIHWCEDVEEETCKQLMEMIFSCNNFGFADEKSTTISIIGTIFRKGFFAAWDERTRDHFPRAKKILILRPFVYFIQLTRWGMKGVKALFFMTPRLTRILKQWNKQKKFLRKIGC